MKKPRWKLIRREYASIPLTPTLRLEMEFAIYQKSDGPQDDQLSFVVEKADFVQTPNLQAPKE